ncbi:MAG: bifunctional riboflavin kinase/FAD synthetase [Porticoccaceae bacterium]|nr:bifunctional riboflavin kinase/FMN adenylyltransferase [Porticoccaceae bacterium]RPG82587.1 MAG: bifunctional riboflavin kinase/FAD synthetase [Cellvibrionales bacterium TMED47]CAI8334040.1 MAG: Riboflavin biosynthesis protein RibF [Cellvibrionales bacterium UBA7375]
MSLIRDIDKSRLCNRESVVTIGSFDGVHIGHQAILQQVIDKAKSLDSLAVAMTFEPQPQEYFAAETAPPRLMRLREKIEALLDFGMDLVVCLRFNDQLSSLTATEFVQDILVHGVNTRHLIVGDDFRFGCDRKGDFDTLVTMGQDLGFSVQNTQTVEVESQRVSSTLVRQLLHKSDFDQVSKLLGRPFSINGKVTFGQQLGRELGFPTANVNLNRFRAPLTGVYAVWVDIEGIEGRFKGAANVGVRPTIGDIEKPILEVHLLDFDRQIYGQRISVEFVNKIRDEQQFTSLEHLSDSISDDVIMIKQWFASNSV